MERITDKLKKLLALAERGCGGEAENARRLLEEHLRKYGMTLEDICENKTSRRTFKYRNKEERTIIIQVFLSVLGSKSEAFKGGQLQCFKEDNLHRPDRLGICRNIRHGCVLQVSVQQREKTSDERHSLCLRQKTQHL